MNHPLVPLGVPKTTIDHAKEHIAELKTLIGQFLNSHPYETFVENDRKLGDNMLYLRFSKPIPRRIRGLAGDAANNLRCSLDQLGFAIALASGTSGKNAHFPFRADANTLYGQPKCRFNDIPRPIFDFMMAFKPYKGGNETLWRLNQLSNTMKHEISLETTIIAGTLMMEGPGFQLNIGARNSSKDKIRLCWIIPGHDYTNQKIKVAPTIRFSDIGDATFDMPAVGFLDNCSSVVNRILLGVEAEARRIKLIV